MTQRFYRNKQYVGIIEARKRSYASCNAILDGRREVWTRWGRPYSILDADQWIELPDVPADKARIFLELAQLTPGQIITEISRIVECTNILDAFQRGADLITRPPR